MKKQKHLKWIVLYIVVLATTIFYSFPNQSEQNDSTETEKITITFRHVWTQQHDQPILNIFQDVINEFEANHPNIKVNFEGLDQTYHREQKLKGEMIIGSPPDMFVLFGGSELDPYVNSNRLLNLKPFIEDNDLEFRDLSLWTYNNGVFGLPFEGHAEPLFYNKDIFQELNITPPSTLDELNQVIEVLQQNGYIPFALGNEALWPGSIYAHYLMDRYAGPTLIEHITVNRATFNNIWYKDAFNQLQQWVKLGAFNEDYANIDTTLAIDLFTERKAAMYLNGNWDITLFNSNDDSDNNDFEDDIGVIPFPTLNEEDDHSITGGYSIGIGLSSNLSGAQKEAALQLMKAFYTEEVQLRIVYEAARLPAMVVSYDAQKTGPLFAEVVQLLESSNRIFLAYDNVLPPEVRKAFWTITDSLLKLELNSEQASIELDKALDSYFKLINSYGGN